MSEGPPGSASPHSEWLNDAIERLSNNLSSVVRLVSRQTGVGKPSTHALLNAEAFNVVSIHVLQPVIAISKSASLWMWALFGAVEQDKTLLTNTEDLPPTV